MIVIDWWGATSEYIELDPITISDTTVISETGEWCNAERMHVQYNTTSKIRRLTGDTLEIQMTYTHSRNRHLNYDDACWGESTIRIEPNSTQGVVIWRDFDDPANNDHTLHWRLLPATLFKKPKRENYTKVKREQDIFRSALLACDGGCVLCKETTIDALEAAHIIPSKEGGAEVVQNGMILRSDLHRLYDSGCFAINPSGQVVDIQNVSEEYKKLLTGAQIPKATLRRVRDALRHQWENASPTNASRAMR